MFKTEYLGLFIDERRLGMDEKPLLVQLNWHMDDREGRFLLRRIDDKTNVSKAASLTAKVLLPHPNVWCMAVSFLSLPCKQDGNDMLVCRGDLLVK